MGKLVPFIPGTIVEDDFLNHQQEVLTGLVTGLYLAPGASSSQLALLPSIDIGGGNLRGQLVASNSDDYMISWTTTSLTNTAYAGGAATVGIWAQTSVAAQTGMGNEGKMSLVVSATQPSDFVRKIGEATASGGNVLSNVRLTNGVFADADQRNNFTFRTVLNSPAETALTLRGGTAQNTTASKVLSVGFDTSGPVYNEKWSLTATGLVRTWLVDGNTTHYSAAVAGEANALLALIGGTIQLGAGGGTALDTTIERTAAATVKLTNTLDVLAIKNTHAGTGTLTGGHAGSVNIDDDLNLTAGKMFRIAGTQISTAALSDASYIAFQNGANSFSNSNTFSASFTGTGVNGYFVRSAAASGNEAIQIAVSGDSYARYGVLASGLNVWGSGALAYDVSLTRTGVGVLKVTKANAASRAALQVSDAPVAGDDLTNKTYVDAKTAVLVTTVRTVTSGADTILLTDDTIFANRTSTGALTLTIGFSAVGNAGKTLTIKDISGQAATYNIIIDANASETIDNAPTYTLNTPREWVVIRSDGANWHVVG